MTINAQRESLVFLELNKLEKIYRELNEEDIDTKKWNKALILKKILLFPTIAFALTFLKVNTDKSIIDLLGILAIGGLIVSSGIFLNYLLSKGR